MSAALPRPADVLPHRPPFLLLDEVTQVVPGQSARGLWRLTGDEWFFPGHFPGRPLMPGVMIIEALAQTAGILAFVSAGVVPNHETKFYFVGIDKARFRKPVEPGDQLILTVSLERALKGIWKFSSAALVGETEVAHAEMMVAPETGK